MQLTAGVSICDILCTGKFDYDAAEDVRGWEEAFAGSLRPEVESTGIIHAIL